MTTTTPAGRAWETFGATRTASGDRSAFYVDSGPDRIYASLYAAPAGPTTGFVLCPSWNRDGRTSLEWAHRMAAGISRMGGAGVVVHWAGFQDSTGEAEQASFDGFVDAALAAVDEARARCGVERWSAAGISVGAATAALVGLRLEASHLVLAQPVIDPKAYFDQMERRGRRSSFGRAPEGWAFGAPIPAGLRADDVQDRVRTALSSHRGRGLVVHQGKGLHVDVPPGFDVRRAWGRYDELARLGSHPLMITALRWLGRNAEGLRRRP